MNTPPDWALEIANKIFETEYDKPSLDLMSPPWGFDADTALHVYDALIWLHRQAVPESEQPFSA